MAQKQKRSTYFHTDKDVNEKNLEDVCQVYDEQLRQAELANTALLDGLTEAAKLPTYEEFIARLTTTITRVRRL